MSTNQLAAARRVRIRYVDTIQEETAPRRRRPTERRQSTRRAAVLAERRSLTT